VKKLIEILSTHKVKAALVALLIAIITVVVTATDTTIDDAIWEPLKPIVEDLLGGEVSPTVVVN
jgi:hypothetical protein